MFAKIKSSYLNGIYGVGVDVECDVSSYGLPSFSIVGLGDNAIKESKERVKASLKNLDYHFFNHPVTINLAPADMKKDGSHFDLPVAISILKAVGIIDKNLDEYLILGERQAAWCNWNIVYDRICKRKWYHKNNTASRKCYGSIINTRYGSIWL